MIDSWKSPFTLSENRSLKGISSVIELRQRDWIDLLTSFRNFFIHVSSTGPGSQDWLKATTSVSFLPTSFLSSDIQNFFNSELCNRSAMHARPTTFKLNKMFNALPTQTPTWLDVDFEFYMKGNIVYPLHNVHLVFLPFLRFFLLCWNF